MSLRYSWRRAVASTIRRSFAIAPPRRDSETCVQRNSLGPEGIYLKQQAFSLLRREVEKLKPTMRSVVDKYYGSECSMEETASALDISLAAAKSRLSRGRVRLRFSLARYGDPRSRN